MSGCTRGGGVYNLVQQEGISFSLFSICAGFGSCLVLHHVTYLTDSLLSFSLFVLYRPLAARWGDSREARATPFPDISQLPDHVPLSVSGHRRARDSARGNSSSRWVL